MFKFKFPPPDHNSIYEICYSNLFYLFNYLLVTVTVATLHRATSIPRAEGAFSRCAIFTAFWVFSAFKMRVYLGRIVELDREPTCEVGPELAIYRSVTGCDERRGRRGEQAAPLSSAAFQ